MSQAEVPCATLDDPTFQGIEILFAEVNKELLVEELRGHLSTGIVARDADLGLQLNLQERWVDLNTRDKHQRKRHAHQGFSTGSSVAIIPASSPVMGNAWRIERT